MCSETREEFRHKNLPKVWATFATEVCEAFQSHAAFSLQFVRSSSTLARLTPQHLSRVHDAEN